MQVYVLGKSKADINRRLESGQALYGIEYTPFGETHHCLWDCPNGTVVKVYEKTVGGSPYAKAYGTVKRRDGHVRIA